MLEERQEAPVEPAFSHFYSFALDPFQIEAIDQIRAGESVMVAAPTSSGKTLVAEYALWRCLQNGSRAIYTTPIKALSNQKRRDLEALFPGRVGLLTGDRSERPDAPIVVMTTEVLRNMLVEDAEPLRDVSCVVFDEVHYLADPERGTVWEEAIITCPRHVQLVCLSATIANAEEVAAWIAEIHRPIALVRRDERPVPLEHFYWSDGRLQLVRDEGGERRATFPRDRRIPAPRPSDVVRAMRRADLLPAIWFAFSRAAVEEAADALVTAVQKPEGRQREEIERAIAWTLDALPPQDRRLPQLTALVRLLRHGVGFHHAGLLPPMKELVEDLFISGNLSVVCATDTLAVGINMPARTVVISNLARPLGGTLTPNEFSQLTGRAGRRGIDEWGGVVMLPGRSYAFEEAYREVCSPLQPISSAFRLRYSTLLSALEGRDDRLETLVQSSLRQFQMKRRARTSAHELGQLCRDLDLDGDDAGALAYLTLQSRLSEAEKEQKRAKNARLKNSRSRPAVQRHERARREREGLQRALREHPYHGRAMELERGDAERMALLRRLQKLQSIVDTAESECEEDARQTAAAVRAVLTRLGYVTERGLTPKARGLREIVAPSGIVLTELYERGAFDDLKPNELAEVISWFACDSRRRRNNDHHLPRALFRLRRQAADAFRTVAGIEEKEGIELTQGPSDWFYGVAQAWCLGASIATIMERIALSEGDIVSLLNKTVDLLDQFEGMLARYSDGHLLAVAGEARRQLVKGLVAMVRSGESLAEDDLLVAAAR